MRAAAVHKHVQARTPAKHMPSMAICCKYWHLWSKHQKQLATVVRGAQVVDVIADQIAAAPEIRLVHYSWLLAHICHSPQNGLLHEEGVCVRQAAEGPRRVVLPRVDNVKVVPARVQALKQL